jgi:hypothetical protein
MTRFAAALVGTALMMGSVTIASSVVHAAPPTVVPSPGYDARLRESRAAPGHAMSAPAYVPHRQRIHPHHRVGDRRTY